MDVTPAVGRRALNACKKAIRQRDKKAMSVAILTILGWITLIVLDLLGEIEPSAEQDGKLESIPTRTPKEAADGQNP
jgi:hypothetical protein